MKTKKKIIIGSKAFFGDFEDFTTKDTDVLAIMDTFIEGKNNLNMKIHGEDVFMYRDLTKRGFIDDALNSGVPMRAGKFLVPEFVEYIHLTIEELGELKVLFDNIDDMHSYERVVFESYLENGDFFLTEEQLRTAYEDYKSKRKIV